MRYFSVYHDHPRGIYVYHELRLARGMVAVIDGALALYHRAAALLARTKAVPPAAKNAAPLHAPREFELPDAVWRTSIDAEALKSPTRVVLTPSGRAVVVDNAQSPAWMYLAEEAADRFDSAPASRTLH